MKIIQIVAMEKVSTIGSKAMKSTIIYGLSDDGILYERIKFKDKDMEEVEEMKVKYKWKKVLTSEDIFNVQ